MTPIFKTIGLLRFSVLTPTYYSETFPTLEETAAHLFSRDRMDLRFRLFEKLCLPSLVNQTDPDFTAFVLTAEAMPQPYLDRLSALIDPLPNIHLRRVGTDKHYPLLRDAYNSVPLDGASHRIMFRLDDDDAVDRAFIARTKRLAQGLASLHKEMPPTIISYNRGFYVRMIGEDKNEVFDACERAPLSTGVTLVAPADHETNPYRYVHRKFPQHYNTYSDISVPGFIRTIHGDNKSDPTVMGLTHNMRRKKIDEELQTHFGVRLHKLRNL